MIFGLKKFHQYLYGQQFKIFTDHKPLLGLFKADEAVPTLASPSKVGRTSSSLRL